MIREIFEIEPKQKNALIIYSGISLISFLQIYIFKRELIDENFLIVLMTSLALGVCWLVLNMIPLIIIIAAWARDGKLIFENVIFGIGILVIAGLILLTYLGYLDNLSFKDFIEYAWKRTLSAYGILFILIIGINVVEEYKTK